MSNFG
jgi:hypothetical protein